MDLLQNSSDAGMSEGTEGLLWIALSILRRGTDRPAPQLFYFNVKVLTLKLGCGFVLFVLPPFFPSFLPSIRPSLLNYVV